MADRPLRIDAAPGERFFIGMITKDIELDLSDYR